MDDSKTVSAPDPAKTGCIFCDKPREDRDEENLILHRGERAYALMNLYPYNNGHLMIAPYAHTADFPSVDAETLLEIMTLAQRAQNALSMAYRPEGYNLGMNLGRVAGAGIAEHMHLHIVPRWNGDTNFMPVLGETKVLPDTLLGSYEKIRACWR